MEIRYRRNFDPKIGKIQEKGKDKLQELVYSVNNITAAQEAIVGALQFILKRKNFNIPLVTNMIGDAIITAIDSSNEVIASATDNKKRMLAKKLSKFIFIFSNSIGKE